MLEITFERKIIWQNLELLWWCNTVASEIHTMREIHQMKTKTVRVCNWNRCWWILTWIWQPFPMPPSKLHNRDILYIIWLCSKLKFPSYESRGRNYVSDSMKVC